MSGVLSSKQVHPFCKGYRIYSYISFLFAPGLSQSPTSKEYSRW